ncbi:hypothetical protein HPP92_002284 [Vanilla planifolia]|uniref:Cyclin-dependent kinase inhibitor n=1 Tax=Vanilla planifolia TaxID=51239 RepID=A0A835SDH8_VANPL|nr:hypothetical protein HPP92_002284 [Vanilla planifolia]
MGKYVAKGKTTEEFAAVGSSSKPYFGVRTRAKTLAVDRLRKFSPSLGDPAFYLQLRNRRLEKFPTTAKRHKKACKDFATFRPNPSLDLGQHRVSELASYSGTVDYVTAVPLSYPANESGAQIGVSFGENNLEVEELKRKIRETTSCSIARDSEDLGTPVSSSRSSNLVTTNIRIRSPTLLEIEEFFAGVEQSQLKLFTEKYNYDPVNDCPLPGRYEWVTLK